jgi:FkbM family methyltransferase
MLVRFLGSIKRRLSNSPLRAPLARLGLIAAGRRVYNRRVLAEGTHTVAMFGQRLTFRVSSAVEIRRVDSMAREGAFVERMLQSLRRGDVCWDVGANIGVATLLLAGWGHGVRVHAYEPEPRNARRLGENVRLNGLEGSVTIHELALSSESRTIPLRIQGDLGTGTHSILSDGVEGDAVAVVAARADDLRTVPAPDLIKVDVEGAEMRVLRGAEDLLRRGTVRDLFIEVHPARLLRDGTPEEEMERWLAHLGYTPVGRGARGGERHVHFARGAPHPGERCEQTA